MVAMNTASRSYARGLLTLLILLILAVPLTTSATDTAMPHPISPDRNNGWRMAQAASPSQVGGGLEFGLMWDSETVWEYAGPDGVEAVVRLNAGPIIPGDVIVEYLIRSCRPNGEVIGLVYGQASYAGSDSTAVSVSERYCAIPPVFEQHTSVGSGDVRWSNLREVLTTWRYVNDARYVFPVEHGRMLFGPTGHLGFAIALSGMGDTGVTAIAIVAASAGDVRESAGVDAETDETAQADAESSGVEAADTDDSEPALAGTEPTEAPSTDTAGASAAGTETAEAGVAVAEAASTEVVRTQFATPEATAKSFLHAVMVDKDPVKAAEAWSPRIAASALETVVATEIELFSDRSSDLLLYVLSSLEYSAEPTPNGNAIVYVVDGDERAVLGRLEKHGDEWFIIALGYQLDASLNVLPEWKRVAGLE